MSAKSRDGTHVEASEASEASTASSGPCDSTLVVTHDREFAGQLRTILETDHRYRVETVFSYRDATRLVSKKRPQTVFLDLRSAGTHEDPSGLLFRLS